MNQFNSAFTNFIYLPFNGIKNWNNYSFARKSVFFISLFWYIGLLNLIIHRMLQFLNLIYPQSLTKSAINLFAWFLCGIFTFYFAMKSKKNSEGVQNDADSRGQRLGLLGGGLMLASSLLVLFTGIYHEFFR